MTSRRDCITDLSFLPLLFEMTFLTIIIQSYGSMLFLPGFWRDRSRGLLRTSRSGRAIWLGPTSRRVEIFLA